MYNFFKEIAEIAKYGKEYKSIKDLTIDLANSGGYRRECVTLKNGKSVLRTRYGINQNGKIIPTWDDVLVAKWLFNYKDLFLSKLGVHPELKEFYPEIIQRTFTIYFNSLQIDKIYNDSNVNTIVYICLANRIGEALIKLGSNSRLDSYNDSGNYCNKDSRKRINLKNAINHMAVSFDKLKEQGYSMDKTYNNISDLLIFIENALVNNPFGKRVLYSLLYSGKRVNTNKIDDFIELSEDEKNSETLKCIKNAWDIIKSILCDFLKESDFDVSKYNWSRKDRFNYSKEI